MSNLLDIRKLFVQLSGRYDLVKDVVSYEDDGANFFIQAGQRMLDRKVTHPKTNAEISITTEADKASYMVPSLLSIEGVQRGSDTGRVTLNHASEQEINEQDPSLTTSEGSPAHYSLLTNLRRSDLGNAEQDLEQLAIKLFPTPDQAYTLYVFGRLSTLLGADDDTSYWTLQHPDTLVTAALYQVEKFHRNTSGMNDYMNALREDIRDIEGLKIESEIGSNNQMNDSFEFRGGRYGRW